MKQKPNLFKTLSKLTATSATVAPPDLKVVLGSTALTSEGIGRVQDCINDLDNLLEKNNSSI